MSYVIMLGGVIFYSHHRANILSHDDNDWGFRARRLQRSFCAQI